MRPNSKGNSKRNKTGKRSARLAPCCDHEIRDPALLTAPALALKGVSTDAQGSYISDVRGDIDVGCGPFTAVLAKVLRASQLPPTAAPPNPPPPNGADTPHTINSSSYYFKRVHGATVGTDNHLVVWARCGTGNVWFIRTRQFEGA